MSVILKGNNGNNVNADSNNNLNINAPLNAVQSGNMCMASESHDGSVGVGRLVRTTEVSPDFRLRVGMDGLFWADTFNHGQFNVSKYKGVDTTMTKAMVGGRLALNSGNALASGNATQVQTWRTFPLHLSYGLYADYEILFTQDPVANNVCEFGLGYCTGVATPTDGIFFRLNASGVLLGVINNNGSETSTVLPYLPQAYVLAHYLIVVHNDETEFWINDMLYGKIPTPTAVGSPCLSMNLPLMLREYNSNATSVAQRMEVASCSVSTGDMDRGRLWATTMVGMGQSSVNITDGTAAGQTANFANSAAPSAATLSNTAAGYANVLGGKFSFAAPVGATTDFALFGFLNPASSATVPGRNLIVRGIRIDSYVGGAAVATTATVLDWGIGIGASAVSLATTDSATSGTRAARRLTLGIQSFPIGAAIGTTATPIDINLDAPVLIEPNTYFHVILRVPIGTATASMTVNGNVFINGYFE